jgi:ArsR family transcriptional regulator, arsenate/arsenite/antimonite-responsive transcriptional repressor
MNGVHLAVEEINAVGGIGGKPIKILSLRVLLCGEFDRVGFSLSDTLRQEFISFILDIWMKSRLSPRWRRSPNRPGSLHSGCWSSASRRAVPAGELARLADVPQNTMSAHLGILARAGLIVGERQSRSILYRANLGHLREMTLFLLKDCCGGHPDLCAPLINDLTPCCPREETAHD